MNTSCTDSVAQAGNSHHNDTISPASGTIKQTADTTNDDDNIVYLASFVNEIDKKLNALQEELGKPGMDKPLSSGDGNTVVWEAPSNGLKFEKRKAKTTVTKHIVNKSGVVRTIGSSVLINESSESDSDLAAQESKGSEDSMQSPKLIRRRTCSGSKNDHGYETLEDVRISVESNEDSKQVADVEEESPTINLFDPAQLSRGNPNKMQLKRRVILLQLHEAEDSYVQALKNLVMRYYLPLKRKRITTDHNINIIFYKVPEINMHHQLLLHQYSKLLGSWLDSCTVGDVLFQAFSKTSMKESYLDFLTNFLSCQQTLRVCRSSTAFSRFLEQQSKHDEKRYNIDDLLIQPVQRIPRYELFIKDLIRCTAEDHPDYDLLQKAQECVHQLAVEIDEAKDALTCGAHQDLRHLGEEEEDDESSLSSSESDEYTMQAKVIFQEGREKRREGRIFLNSGRIALMYRKRRTVFLSRQEPEENDEMSILKPSFRKQYVPKFEARLIDIKADDISEDEGKIMRTLAMTKDYSTLKAIKALAAQLSTPIPCLVDVIEKALVEKQPTELLEDEEIELLQWKLRELQLKIKNKHDSTIIVWFNSSEERVAWRNAINNYSASNKGE